MDRSKKESLIKLAEGLQKEMGFEPVNSVKHPFQLTNAFAVILRLRDINGSSEPVKKPDFDYLEQSQLVKITDRLYTPQPYLQERANHSVGFLHF